ncbi:MAG: NOL1/NOP2/sun family putative RNA methylase [Bacillales bacterium]|nr:NOL1/NOP2/sun family putative RNA methylase [Bacillales bacterium]
MDFETHLEKYLPKQEIDKLINSFNDKEQKALYLNTEKMSNEQFEHLFPLVKKHPIVENAYLYDKDVYDFGKLDYFDLGVYYIQEPSAMLVSYFLNPNENDLVLDLCAAPGGKTFMSSRLMMNKGQIIANDLSKSRAQILLSNVERMGLKNVIVSSFDFANYYHLFIEKFDKIILDAPCSGSGMFRKDEKMKLDWSMQKVYANANIQSSLISMCAKMLKKGGKLIYSTCSYSYEEDEEIIINFLNEHNDFHLIDINQNNPLFYQSDNLKGSIHLFPYLYPGEGHFICLLQKDGNANKTTFNKINYQRNCINENNKKVVENYIINTNINEKFLSKCLRPGYFISTQTKDNIIPSHHFAKSINDFQYINLDDEQYKKYIHGDSFPYDEKNGFYVAKYKNINVGIVKIVDKIIKNYYPKGLRR